MSTPVQDKATAVPVAVLAEFVDIPSVRSAALAVRDAGYRRWDVHSPFPIHGIDEALGIRPTVLPWIVLVAGVAGALGGLLLAWYTNAVDYPFLVSGKPLFSLPALVPVIFETTILFAAFAAVLGMLGLNLLPMLSQPLLRSHRFRRVTSDRFFVVIDAGDEKFDRQETARWLRELGARHVEEVEGP